MWAIPLVALFLYLYFDTGLPFRALSEVPYVPIIFGALLCTAAAVTAQSRRQRLLLAVSAGLLAGAAVLMRHMGVAILPALAAALLLAPQREDEEGARPLWQITLGMVVGLAIVVLPWLVPNLLVGSELLGLERPASQMSLRDLAFWTGSMIYLHLGPALLALTFAAVGYHLRPRGEDSRREAFISTLIAGAGPGLAAYDVRDGSIIWETSVVSEGGRRWTQDPSPALAGDDLLLAWNSLHALSAADGEQRWEYEHSHMLTFTPTIADGKVLTILLPPDEDRFSRNRLLAAIDVATGEQLWTAPVTSRQRGIYTSPVVADGRVYAFDDEHLYALDLQTGEVLWQLELAAADVVTGSAAISGEGSSGKAKGRMISQNSRATRVSPARKRAFSSAWRSQVCARSA